MRVRRATTIPRACRCYGRLRNDFDANFKLTWDQQTMNAMDAYVELFCTDENKVPTMLGAALARCRLQERPEKSRKFAGHSVRRQLAPRQ